MKNAIFLFLTALFISGYAMLHYKYIYNECFESTKIHDEVVRVVFGDEVANTFIVLEGCELSGFYQNYFRGRICRYTYSIRQEFAEPFYDKIISSHRWRKSSRCLELSAKKCGKELFIAGEDLEEHDLLCDIMHYNASLTFEVYCFSGRLVSS